MLSSKNMIILTVTLIQRRYFTRERNKHHIHYLKLKSVIFILPHQGERAGHIHSCLLQGCASPAMTFHGRSPEGPFRTSGTRRAGRGAGSAWQSGSTATKHGISTARRSPRYPQQYFRCNSCMQIQVKCDDWQI